MNIDKIACWHKSEKINTQNNSTVNNCNCTSFDNVLKEQETIAAQKPVTKYGVPKPKDDDIEKYAIPDIDEPVEEPSDTENSIKYYPPLLKYAVPNYYGEKTSPVGKYSIPSPPLPMYDIPVDKDK